MGCAGWHLAKLIKCTKHTQGLIPAPFSLVMKTLLLQKDTAATKEDQAMISIIKL